MPYQQFDRTRIHVEPLENRENDLSVKDILPLDSVSDGWDHPSLPILAERIVQARRSGAAVILMMGAHVIRKGVGLFLIDLMERGYISHIGLNGAGCIHDYEFALIGATTESVAKYIRIGQFGIWRETGGINDIAVQACKDGVGLGEAVGKTIQEGDFPHKNVSILAAGYRLHIPVTVHVAIGQDIIHELPNCDGAALGESSYRDFLVFTQSITGLENGVYMSAGSAVMGPEVYLKALSMARNVSAQEGRKIAHFTSAVFDLIDLGDDWSSEASKSDPRYYYRPYKTILVRTVADGGESYYIRGDHRQTIPALYRHIQSSARKS